MKYTNDLIETQHVDLIITSQINNLSLRLDTNWWSANRQPHRFVQMELGPRQLSRQL